MSKELTKLKNKAQTIFNSFIRERDKQPNGKWTCISCQKEFDRIHAGHYFSTKYYDHMRFDPDNCHSQCPACNTFKDGNIIAYRYNLLKKIGKERLYYLELKGLSPLRPKHTIESLKILLNYLRGDTPSRIHIFYLANPYFYESLSNT